VIVFASSAAMALSFDAGGEQRQKNYWVEDPTDDEAKESKKLLALHGHREDWKQFVKACVWAALFALFCREGPCAALVGVSFRRLPCSGFGANLRRVQGAGDAEEMEAKALQFSIRSLMASKTARWTTGFFFVGS